MEVKSVDGDTVTVANSALEPVAVATKGIVFTPGGRAWLGIRPQYLTPAEGGRGQLHGKVQCGRSSGALMNTQRTMNHKASAIIQLNGCLGRSSHNASCRANGVCHLAVRWENHLAAQASPNLLVENLHRSPHCYHGDRGSDADSREPQGLPSILLRTLGNLCLFGAPMVLAFGAFGVLG